MYCSSSLRYIVRSPSHPDSHMNTAVFFYLPDVAKLCISLSYCLFLLVRICRSNWVVGKRGTITWVLSDLYLITHNIIVQRYRPGLLYACACKTFDSARSKLGPEVRSLYAIGDKLVSSAKVVGVVFYEVFLGGVFQTLHVPNCL